MLFSVRSTIATVSEANIVDCNLTRFAFKQTEIQFHSYIEKEHSILEQYET